MNRLARQQILKDIGIDAWYLRDLKPAADCNNAPDWDALENSVLNCRACELASSRTNAVFGVGNKKAELMIIGEAPGKDEDLQGKPFVGRAGKLLDAMLKAIGFDREDVFIANILKCRPPNNRDPEVGEINKCQDYLYRQIELINPKVILCAGRIAAQTLLKTNTAIGRLRGNLHKLKTIPLIVTYHPAYLLRKPTEKAKSWQDLKLVVQLLEKS